MRSKPNCRDAVFDFVIYLLLKLPKIVIDKDDNCLRKSNMVLYFRLRLTVVKDILTYLPQLIVDYYMII